MVKFLRSNPVSSKTIIKVIDSTKKVSFEQEINDYLEKGWKLSSTASGVIYSEEYDFCSWYQAILYKEGTKEKNTKMEDILIRSNNPFYF